MAAANPDPAPGHLLGDGGRVTASDRETDRGHALVQARDHHVTFLAETPAGAFLYAAAGTNNASVFDSVERASVAMSSLFHGLTTAIEDDDTSLYYEDVYARLLTTDCEAPLVDISDLAWTEVDTREDLSRAAAMVASGRLAG